VKRFSQYLHRPFQILWFETDELAFVSVMMGLLILTDSIPVWLWLIALVSGLWGFRRLKERYPRGFAKHIMHEAGFVSYKGYPDADKGDFYE
jgi:hypothetical protein